MLLSRLLTYQQQHLSLLGSVVVKDLRLKDEDKDKESSFKDKDLMSKDEDLKTGPQGQRLSLRTTTLQ